MATDFTLPELGENILAGDVLRVLVKPGDTIAKDQPVVELETDKATIEVPSSVEGKVTDVKVKPGDRVKVGQAILTVETPSQPAAAPEGVMPEAAKLEEERAVEVVPAPRARAASAPDRANVVAISRGARAAAEPAAAPAFPPASAAPSVRRMARELGVEIDQVPGSGPSGRISVEDVKAYAKRLLTTAAEAKTQVGGAAAEPLPDFSRWGEVERQPMRAIRRRTAERLAAAWATVPHVTQHELADITALEELRKKYTAQAEAAGGNLTITVIALKVAAAALKAFPQVNASIDVAASEIIYKKYVHIGVAVDTDRGLLVPVVRNVDTKGLIQLSVELSELSSKARAGKLSLEEMQGGSFTISNLGGIGGTAFTPIVNAPEVAILGISRARIEPAFQNGSFVPRLMLPLSLSYDHRAIDGADGVRFVRWIADALEQPFLLALQG